MGYVDLNFLGETYQVSEAAREFLDYEALLTPMVAELEEHVVAQRKRDAALGAGSWIENAEEDVAACHAKMRAVAEYFVQQLVERGIYDVSANDLISKTESFENVEKLAVYAARKALDQCRDIVDAQQRGVDTAYSAAASNVTGSGVTVFSSSIATLAVMSAVECGMLMSQAKEADREYQEAVEKLRLQATTGIDRVCNEVAAQDYYPGLTMFLVDYAGKIYSAFFDELVAHGKFDLESVQGYSLKRADNMLDNLGRVPDKKGFLRVCFQTCPYSEKLYRKTFEAGLMDAETFETAKYFGFGDLLDPEIEAQCKRLTGNSEQLEKAVALLCSSRQIGKRDALAIAFEDDVASLSAEAGIIREALSGPAGLSSWIGRDLTGRASELCEWDEREVGAFVEAAVDKALSSELFDRLAANDLVDGLDLPMYSSGMSCGELRCAVAQELSQRVAEYAARIKTHVERCQAECEAMQQTLDRRACELEALKEKAKQAVEELERQRSGMRLTAFSARKEIKEKIKGIQSGAEQAEKSCRLDDMKRAVSAKKSEADSLDADLLDEKWDGELSLGPLFEQQPALKIDLLEKDEEKVKEPEPEPEPEPVAVAAESAEPTACEEEQALFASSSENVALPEKTPATVPTVEAVTAEPAVSSTAGGEKPKKGRKALGILLVLAVIAAAVVYFLLFYHPSSSVEETEDVAPVEETAEEDVEPEPEPVVEKGPKSGMKDGFVYDTLDDDTVVIQRYEGVKNEVTVPDLIAGRSVSKIAESAFEGRDDIKELYIFADLVEIGPCAFKGCSQIDEVTIPSTVEKIGASAFEDCTALENAYIFADFKAIPKMAFRNCKSLEEITIPDSVKSIGESAFEGCTSMTNAYLFGGGRIGKNAFKGCSSLEEVTLSDDISSVGYCAFKDCTGLADVYFMGAVEVGECAFSGCTSLKDLSIGSEVISIGEKAFENCTGLTEVYIYGEDTVVDRSAFDGCKNLKTIK